MQTLKGIVFEDYTNTGDNPIIAKRKVQQADGHANTLSGKYPTVTFSTVFCSTSSQIYSSALPHATDILYIHKDDFIVFSEKARKYVRQLWDLFSELGNHEWREKAIKMYVDQGLDIKSLIAFFGQNKLRDLTVVQDVKP